MRQEKRVMFANKKYFLFVLFYSLSVPAYAVNEESTKSSPDKYEQCEELPYYYQEQQYLIREKQLDSYNEARGLIYQGDVTSAQRAILFSLEKMKLSCDINQYELSYELQALAWILAQDKRYAEAQELFEKALPLAEFDSFKKGFLLSAAKYAWLGGKDEQAINLINRKLSADVLNKLAPQIWHFDENTNQLLYRVANMSFPIISDNKWLLTDVEPAKSREYTTWLTYRLHTDGKIRFSITYNEERPQPTEKELAKKTAPPTTFDINQLPDFPGVKTNQVRKVIMSEKNLTATWDVQKGDWQVEIYVETPQEESQSTFKAIADLFDQIKWENPPKLYQQQTMQAIENELDYLGLSPDYSPIEDWNKGKLIAQKALAISAFPAEYQKYYSIIGIADYQNGKYTDAWQMLKKAYELHPYSRQGWEYENMLLYAALSAFHCEDVKTGNEILGQYIYTADIIDDRERWTIDSNLGLIQEKKEGGMAFPFRVAQNILKNATKDYLYYSFDQTRNGFFVQILEQDTEQKSLISQSLKKMTGQEKKITLTPTEQSFSGGKQKMTRWKYTESATIQDNKSPTEGVYWFIPWQGKMIVVFNRNYDEQAPGIEQTDAFVYALFAQSKQ